MILHTFYYVTVRPSFIFLEFCASWFCMVAFQHSVIPFPGVIVKVFGYTNSMWSREWLKSCRFDFRINITSLTFQCWAPKRDYEEKQAPYSPPLQSQYYAFDLIFTVSKSCNPEPLVIKAQVRWQRYSSALHWLTLLPDSVQVLLSYVRVSRQTTWFLIPKDSQICNLS